MWEKNFWKIYSVSRCSSDIEHKPITYPKTTSI